MEESAGRPRFRMFANGAGWSGFACLLASAIREIRNLGRPADFPRMFQVHKKISAIRKKSQDQKIKSHEIPDKKVGDPLLRFPMLVRLSKSGITLKITTGC